MHLWAMYLRYMFMRANLSLVDMLFVLLFIVYNAAISTLVYTFFNRQYGRCN